ncbi:MAG TPA: DUF2059 domain-containing protein [Devosia sp.]|nr:DUF2059 domain-containing protein [Devosia sp.]
MNSSTLSRLRRWAAPLFVVLTLIVAGSVAAPAAAQEIPPDQLALARKYVDLINTSNLFRGVVLKTAIGSFKALTVGHADIEKDISDAVDRTIKSYAGDESDLLDQIARVYATVFTLEELQQIVAFYESPVGQKLAQASPELSKTTDDVLKVYQNNLSAEFVRRVRADLKEKGITI